MKKNVGFLWQIIGNIGSQSFQVAQEYSECPSGKKGGDLGWFPRGKMAGPFQEVAFNTSVGATSAPFKSTYASLFSLLNFLYSISFRLGTNADICLVVMNYDLGMDTTLSYVKEGRTEPLTRMKLISMVMIAFLLFLDQVTGSCFIILWDWFTIEINSFPYVY